MRDNGLGNSPDLLPKLFDLFTRGNRSLDRSEGGLGIGLTIVRSPARNFRVLVIDDHADTARGMAKLLQLSGHDVRVAYNGEDALNVAGGQRPEVMLLDIGLPGMDAYELASALRGEEWGRASASGRLAPTRRGSPVASRSDGDA